MRKGQNAKLLMHLVRSLRARTSAARAGWRQRSSAPPPQRAQGQADLGGAEPPSVEPSFPQLEVARDPEQMREVFQRHLRPLGEEDYRIRECRISHVRHRQAAHCTLRYTLRLEEPGTGRERVQEVTGVIYAGGRSRRIWEELRKSEPGRVIPDGASPAFEPFSYVPELDMLVQAFPYDHRLPALPLLMSPPPPSWSPCCSPPSAPATGAPRRGRPSPSGTWPGRGPPCG